MGAKTKDIIVVNAFDEVYLMQKTTNDHDPLAELDRQWDQERIGYVGVHNADRRIKIASLSVVGSLLFFFILAGAAFLKEGINQGDVQFFLATLLIFGFSLVLGFGLHAIIRLRLAERRYLKKRAKLLHTLPALAQTKPLQYSYRISSPLNPQSAQWTAAETQIYTLQELHYAEPKRDKAYAAAIQKIIVDAPKSEQAYLSELVQLEQRWVVERLRYRNIQPYYQHYHYRQLANEDEVSYPLPMKTWMVLVIGTALLGLGCMLAWNGSTTWLNILLVCSFGLVWIFTARELYRISPNLQRAEQNYINNQYALAQKHDRLASSSDLGLRG